MQLNFMGQVTTETCTEITPDLESTGDYEAQCCRVSFLNDALLAYKRMLGEDWKAKLIEQYELDEDITEDEIREKLGLKNEQSMCSLLTKIGKNTALYGMGISSLDGEVKYDCGDGEETFNAKDFVPETDFEKKIKISLIVEQYLMKKVVLKNLVNLLLMKHNAVGAKLLQ